MEIDIKTCRCDHCGEIYQLNKYDNNPIHNKFCCGDCQYYGEVVPYYIETTSGVEKKYWQEELLKGLPR